MAEGDYSYRQLEQLWINAGGRRSLAPLMAGVAEVESSGNPDAHNNSGASGLWQIEVPSHDDLIPGGAANVYDPQDNAKAAVALSGNSLSGIADNWLQYEPAGEAQQITREHGGTVPTGNVAVPGEGGGPGGEIQTTADPVPGIIEGLIPGLSIITDRGLGGTAGVLQTFTNNLESIEHGIEWFFVPNHWVRILCFVFGVPLVGIGIVTMTRTGRPYSVSNPLAGTQAAGFSLPSSFPAVGGELAPALGIAEVAIGAVLLFVAFHNLQAEGVDSLPTLISYLQKQLQQNATATTSGDN